MTSRRRLSKSSATKMSGTRCRIVLDTNVLVADWWLRSPEARLLREFDAHGMSLLLPWIVLEEAVNAYREEVSVRIRKARDLARLLGEPEAEIDASPDRVDRAASAYRTFLTNEVRRSSGSIIRSSQSVSHDALVRRALHRRRPFGSDDRGYRDALIWESVCSALSKASGDVAFVSSDRIFRQEDGIEVLHDDLQEDLGVSERSRLRFFWSLRSYVDKEIAPTLAEPRDLKAKLLAGMYPGIDLARWARLNVDKAIADGDLAELLVQTPVGEVVEALPTKIREAWLLDVVHCHDLGPRTLVTEFKVRLSGIYVVGIEDPLDARRTLGRIRIDRSGPWNEAHFAGIADILCGVVVDPLSGSVSDSSMTAIVDAAPRPSG